MLEVPWLAVELREWFASTRSTFLYGFSSSVDRLFILCLFFCQPHHVSSPLLFPLLVPAQRFFHMVYFPSNSFLSHVNSSLAVASFTFSLNSWYLSFSLFHTSFASSGYTPSKEVWTKRMSDRRTEGEEGRNEGERTHNMNDERREGNDQEKEMNGV